MRDYELYVADCVDCHKPVESRTLPVPQRCTRCQTALDDKLKPPILNPFDPNQMETAAISELGRMNKDQLRRLAGPLLITEGKERERRVAVIMSYGLYMKIQKTIIDVHKAM
jgi:hypothetical protein